MSVTPHFYIESLSSLYEAVQLSEIFPDSKYFVDAIPLFDSTTILEKYAKEKNRPGFDLKNFVTTHFSLPAEINNHYSSANKTLPIHLTQLWDVLLRNPDEQGGTLIPLPHPYIVPGGRFREVYYWDSYFTMLGLQVSNQVSIIENMVNNFAYLIDLVGFIPNGNRTYYLGRSQPPFFALMLSILAQEKGATILAHYLPQLEKEYAFWMDGIEMLTEKNPAYRRVVLLPDGSILNRYWDDTEGPRPEAFIEDKQLAEKSGRDPVTMYKHIRAAAESGWDFSSRWFQDGHTMETIQTTDLLPVDLNCLLFFMENTLCRIYEKQNPVLYKKLFQNLINRKRAIQEYCWQEEKGFYFDYQFRKKQPSECYTLAAMYPLFFKLVNLQQSSKVALCIKEKFLQPGGLLTTLNTTTQQWDAPNGWAPLQWIAYKGLKNTGHGNLANQLKRNWMHTNEKVFAATGKMMEKYNVTDTKTSAGGGEYPNQDGFGWTNGVYLKFLSKEIPT